MLLLRCEDIFNEHQGTLYLMGADMFLRTSNRSETIKSLKRINELKKIDIRNRTICVIFKYHGNAVEKVSYIAFSSFEKRLSVKWRSFCFQR